MSVTLLVDIKQQLGALVVKDLMTLPNFIVYILGCHPQQLRQNVRF